MLKKQKYTLSLSLFFQKKKKVLQAAYEEKMAPLIDSMGNRKYCKNCRIRENITGHAIANKRNNNGGVRRHIVRSSAPSLRNVAGKQLWLEYFIAQWYKFQHCLRHFILEKSLMI